MFEVNPFAPSQERSRTQREPEHFHAMEDVRRYLEGQLETIYVPQLRRLDLAMRENTDNPQRRTVLETERQTIMEKAQALQSAAKKCHEYQCRPSEFEHVLFEDLQATFRKTEPDMAHINHLRGLLRAGSWFAFDRTSRGVEVQNINKNSEALALISKARLAEAEYWDWQIHLTDPYHRLPEVAGEIETYKEDALRELDMAESAITHSLLGAELESAVRTIEQLHAKLLALSQKFSAQSATSSSADRTSQNHWHDLFIQLRPLRNFLYYRRLYPIQARESLGIRRQRQIV